MNVIKKVTICILMSAGSLLSQFASGSEATYRLTIVNNWTQSAYPINYPPDAHFSWLGGGTHDASSSFWQLGGIASAGMEKMAETGVTSDLVNEIVAAGGDALEWQHWFCQPAQTNTNCGSLIEEFTVNSDRPLLTLTSMLGPSPDWFVGVSGLNLRQGGSWVGSLTIPLALYDGGTEEGSTPSLSNPATSPFEPIALISYNSNTGEYLTSSEEEIVGMLIFELVEVVNDENIPIMPLYFFISLAVFIVGVAHKNNRRKGAKNIKVVQKRNQ